MPRKPKFRPEIRRVKLNPEQAVLLCDCYDSTRRLHRPGHITGYMGDANYGNICGGTFKNFWWHLYEDPSGTYTEISGASSS